MSETSPDIVTSYHAHVYYGAATKKAAARLRTAAERRFEVAMGRWHDRPIGPHPTGSFQIAFAPDLFGRIVPWLALNRNGLVVLVHPNTGDDLADHRDRAIWLGEKLELDLRSLQPAGAQQRQATTEDSRSSSTAAGSQKDTDQASRQDRKRT